MTGVLETAAPARIPQAEATGSGVSFRAQILEAASYAAPYDDETCAAEYRRRPLGERLRKVDDNDLVPFFFTEVPYRVVTDNRDDFLQLIAETRLTLTEMDGYSTEGDTIESLMADEQILKIYEHEMSHADTALRYGNGFLTVRYGVEIVSVAFDGEQRSTYVPFVEMDGWMKRIHAAQAFLAPGKGSKPDEGASPPDIGAAIGCGYNMSKLTFGEIRARAEATPPVSQDDVLRAEASIEPLPPPGVMELQYASVVLGALGNRILQRLRG